MRAWSLVTILVLSAAPAPFVAACSSSSDGSSADGGPSASSTCDKGGADGGTCTAGKTPDYVSCADLTSPTVSFAKDVQPIFTTSCAIGGGACHGDPNNSGTTNGQVFLGLPDGGGTAQLLSGIVNHPSPEDPELELVKSGDPTDSYLMHKLDDDQCQYATACNATMNMLWSAPQANPCGASMPLGFPLLAISSRDTIRRWIAQGAQNN
jgi:hypothetical protein